MRQITLTEFLTEDEIQLSVDLWKEYQELQLEPTAASYALAVCNRITRPNIARINKALGQENDPMYLAYAVGHIMTTVEQGGKQ